MENEERVSWLHSDAETVAKVQRDIRMKVLYYAEFPDEIPARLKALDREWDVERAVEAHVGGVIGVTLLLGMLTSRKWRAVSFIAATGLVAHAFGAWFPPRMFWRKVGLRTAEEIALERSALRALQRGFSGNGPQFTSSDKAVRALEIVGLAGNALDSVGLA